MKKFLFNIILLAGSVPAFAQEVSAPIDSLSYAVGVLAGEQTKQLMDASKQRFEKMNATFDETVMKAAMNAVLNGEKVPFNAQQAVNMLNSALEKAHKEMLENNKKKGEEFLAQNAKVKGVVTTASGLQYKIIKKVKKGEIPADSSRVKVHYEGHTLNGKVFDSSYKRGEPAEFGVKGVIKGWTEVLQLMPVGSKWEVYIPSDLGYGERGTPSGDIAPNETLVFTIELLEIVKKQ